MPGGIFSHRDSLGKCDYPSHLYGNSSIHPSTPAKIKVIPQTKDVLESAQKKVDLEVELKFHSAGKSGVLFFIGQAGKYLFLVAVFPPYFIVYAIPKWLAKELFPKVIDEVQKMWEKGVLLLVDLALWGNKKMFSPLNRLYSNLQAKSRKMTERVREFFQRRKKGIETGIKLFREKSVDPIVGFVQKVSQTLSSFLSSGHSGIKQKLENGLKGFLKKIHSISRQIKIYPHSLQTLFSKAKNWGKEALRVIKTENLRTKDVAEKIVQKWKNAIHPYVETFKQKFHDGQIKIGHYFYQSYAQIADYCSPKVKRAWSLLQNFNHTVKERVQENLVKFVEWSRLAVQWGKINLSPAYQMLSNMAQNFLQFLPRTAVSWISEGKGPADRFIHRLQKTLQYLTLKSLSLKQKIVVAAESFYRFLKQFGEKGKQAYQQGKKIAKAVIKKGVQIALRAIEKGTIFAIRLILWIRILLAWIRVLSLYGMQLLPELTSRILKKVPQLK